MLADFPLVIDHAQVVIHAEDHAAPGLLWTSDHVAQGFAWSARFLSFGVPDHDGESRIQVRLSDRAALEPQALWAVQVPFRVTGPLQIGTVLDTRRVAVPAGDYIVTCQGLPGQAGGYVLRLTFSSEDTPGFRILRKGGDITADRVLRRDAAPAGPLGAGAGQP